MYFIFFVLIECQSVLQFVSADVESQKNDDLFYVDTTAIYNPLINTGLNSIERTEQRRAQLMQQKQKKKEEKQKYIEELASKQRSQANQLKRPKLPKGTEKSQRNAKQNTQQTHTNTKQQTQVYIYIYIYAHTPPIIMTQQPESIEEVDVFSFVTIRVLYICM